jgi:uncharacterized membrane protein YbhN (UPF0104 family)
MLKNSLSVLLTSRLLIILATSVLFILSAFVIFYMPAIRITVSLNFNLIWLPATVFIIILFVKHHKLRKIFRNTFVDKIMYNIKSLIDSIKSEIGKLSEFAILLRVATYTLSGIFTITFFCFFILKGVNINLTIFQIIFVSSINLAVMILPVKGIEGLGTIEGSWVVGLMLLEFPEDIAIKAGFIVHTICPNKCHYSFSMQIHS